jgi:predicted restriction endonuclease
MRDDTIQCLETHITLAHPEINNIGSLSLHLSLFDNDHNSSSFSSLHRFIVARFQRSSQEQHNFRQTLLKLYNGKCAITGCSVVSTLEACHIVPFAEGGSYNPSNGILLRADIQHRLLESKLLWWNSTYIIFIHPDIRKISSEYSLLHGKSFSQNLSHLQLHHYPNSPVPQWIYLDSKNNINDNNNNSDK